VVYSLFFVIDNWLISIPLLIALFISLIGMTIGSIDTTSLTTLNLG